MNRYLEKIEVLVRAHSSPQVHEIKGLRQQSDLTQSWEKLASQWGVGGRQAPIHPLADKASMSSHQSETTDMAREEGIQLCVPTSELGDRGWSVGSEVKTDSWTVWG